MKHRAVLVCDPLLDSGWEYEVNAELVTSNAAKFLHTAQKSRNCSLFLDESGETVGRYNAEMFWLATRARHYGHISHFITQRVQLLNRTCRDQCSHLFLFRVSNSDAETLADDWANNNLVYAANLDKFEFIHCARFGETNKYILTKQGIRKLERYPDASNNTSGINYQRTISAIQ